VCKKCASIADRYPIANEVKTLTNRQNSVKYMTQAEVAELADALRSGRSGIFLVRVQIPPSAQNLSIIRGVFLLDPLVQANTGRYLASGRISGYKTDMENMKLTGKKILAVFGLVILAYLILDLNHRVSELMRLTSERDALATSVAEVKQTQSFLESQIAYANSDAAVEKWAREDASMARAGDHPVVMLPDPKYTPQPTPTLVVTQVVMQNWQIWGELFFGQ
jgi:cell division protein FtsB